MHARGGFFCFERGGGHHGLNFDTNLSEDEFFFVFFVVSIHQCDSASYQYVNVSLVCVRCVCVSVYTHTQCVYTHTHTHAIIYIYI